MNRLIAPFARIAVCIALSAASAAAQERVIQTHNEEPGPPHFAPGRAEVDHARLRMRALRVLERQFGAFRDAAEALAQAAQRHCDAAAADPAPLRTALAEAWRAWTPLESWQFGPVEQSGASLTVNFWPDKKNFVGRGLKAVLAADPAQQADPAFIARASAAVQGLPALERLIFDEAPICPAALGISGNLRRIAAALHQDWFGAGGWADLARAAGPDNPVYQSAEEFTKTLYTAVDFGLQRIHDARLGRPLGSYKRSFPKRAEAWRAGLSRDLIHAHLDGLAEMIEFGFADDVREPDRARILQVIDQAHVRLDRIGEPIPRAVARPQSRIRVESAQTKMAYLRLELARIIGPNLGVDAGFSAADGD